MKYKEAMVAWNPQSATEDITKEIIKVVPWPDKSGFARELFYSVGACFAETHDMTDEQIISQIFIDFNTLVVRDKVAVDLAHHEFLKIDEYRRHISFDIEGAEQW